MQLLVLASVALLVSSLATIAVPNSVGQLIDTCIKFSTGGAQPGGEAAAKKELNSEASINGLRLLVTRVCCHYLVLRPFTICLWAGTEGET